MTRYTRDERARMEALSTFTRAGFSSFTRSVVEIVIMAGIAGGLTQTTQDSMASMLRGAGVAMIVALGLLLMLATVIAVSWMMARHVPQPDDGFPFHETGPNSRRRYPADWTRAEYLEYMRAVHGGRRFSERGAAEFGHDRDKFKALLEWCVDRGWYQCTDGGYDNKHQGTWLAPWATILATTPGDADV